MDKIKKQNDFAGIYRKYVNDIFRFCYIRVSDREQAKDLSQQVFLKAWDYVDKGNDLDNPKAFLYQMPRNIIIDWYRIKKESSLDKMIEEDGYDIPDQNSVSDIYRDSDMKSVLIAMKSIPKEDSDALTMRYIDGMSVSEIAKVLNERENTVSVRIHRAIEKVRDIMIKK